MTGEYAPAFGNGGGNQAQAPTNEEGTGENTRAALEQPNIQ